MTAVLDMDELRAENAKLTAELAALRSAVRPIVAFVARLHADGRTKDTPDCVGLMCDWRNGDPCQERLTVGDMRAVAREGKR